MLADTPLMAGTNKSSCEALGLPDASPGILEATSLSELSLSLLDGRFGGTPQGRVDTSLATPSQGDESQDN